MKETSRKVKRWPKRLTEGLTDYAAKHSSKYRALQMQGSQDRATISMLEENITELEKSISGATKEIASARTALKYREIDQAREEYYNSVVREKPKDTMLLDERGVVRYQGAKAKKLLDNLVGRKISDAFHSPEGDGATREILNTVLDTKGGYLYVQKDGKKFPVEIKVKQIKIQNERHRKPRTHTIRIDILHSGWAVLAKQIVSRDSHPYQPELIVDADRHVPEQ